MFRLVLTTECKTELLGSIYVDCHDLLLVQSVRTRYLSVISFNDKDLSLRIIRSDVKSLASVVKSLECKIARWE